jgi:hypothetical protein
MPRCQSSRLGWGRYASAWTQTFKSESSSVGVLIRVIALSTGRHEPRLNSFVVSKSVNRHSMLSLGNVQDWLSGTIDSSRIRKDDHTVRDVSCQTDHEVSNPDDNDQDDSETVSNIHTLKLEAQVLKLEQRLALGEAALAREEKARSTLEKIVWNIKSHDRGSLGYEMRAQQRKQSEIMSSMMLQEMKDSLLVHSKLAMTKRTFQDQDKIAGPSNFTTNPTPTIT